MKKVSKIGIIGGGSVGLYSANLLLKNLENIEIDIIERHNSLGKKILASGNGKCNFTNKYVSPDHYNDGDFVAKIFNQYDINETLDFFKELGLVFKFDEEGRGYPHSESATTLLEVLELGLSDKVNLILDTTVNKIQLGESKINLHFNNTYKEYDYVIIASGNIASNLSSESNNDYLRFLDLKSREINPSLVPLKTSENFKDISGLRFKGGVSLYGGGELLHKEEGEVLFKNDGVSGIVILQMSHYLNKHKRSDYHLKFDFVTTLNKQELRKYLSSKKNLLVGDIFKGLLNTKLAKRLLSESKIDFDSRTVNGLSEVEIGLLVDLVKEYRINIKETYSFEFAQVASGGILVSEVSGDLSLKRYSNIFVGGEVMDINALSGGYNLQFAWSCAGVIAKALMARSKEK